jgi:hypothetical protein
MGTPFIRYFLIICGRSVFFKERMTDRGDPKGDLKGLFSLSPFSYTLSNEFDEHE